MTNAFIGIDLAWCPRKTTGLAALVERAGSQIGFVDRGLHDP